MFVFNSKFIKYHLDLLFNVGYVQFHVIFGLKDQFGLMMYLHEMCYCSQHEKVSPGDKVLFYKLVI